MEGIRQRVSQRLKLWIVVAVVLATVVGCVGESESAAQAVGNPGHQDFSFGTTSAKGPVGEPNQSKLWFNDGFWWGTLFDSTSGEFRIYRYDWASQSWTDTGTLIDKRGSSKADVLWDGAHLYAVSVGPAGTNSGDDARIVRYSYDPANKSYSPDQGFPVAITSGGMKTITLAKDTTGRLWVAYTRDDRIHVAHSSDDDLTWSTPFVLPAQGTSVTRDDTPAIVAFGSRIGVMWSNHLDDAFYFATHADGDPDDSWQESTAIQGPGIADDGINLKADSSGRVFAAVKTSLNDGTNPDPDAPLILLLVRDPDGNWSRHVFGRVADGHTRPTVLIDEENRNLFVFATDRCCRGGSIYYKRTSLDDISFSEGKGVPFISSATDTHINDATSTKQNLDSTTKLLVEAADAASGYYWHNALDLADTTPPTVQPPGHDFVANSTLGTSTLPVKLAWSGADEGRGVVSYALKQSIDAGSFTSVPLPSATSTTATLKLVPDRVYRFGATAADGGGNVSGSAYGPEFSTDVHQETSDTVVYSGAWTDQAVTSAYGGSVRYAEAKGDVASFDFAGSDVGWIAQKGPNRGKAQVWVDGAKAKNVDLYAPTIQPRKAVFTQNWSSSGYHTLEVRVMGTKNTASTGTRVDIDAFAVLGGGP